MTTSESAAIDKPRSASRKSANPTKYLYCVASFTLLLLMLVGFQQFYLHGKAFPNRSIAPPIFGLVIVHGVTMSLWIMLLVQQSFLIINRKHKFHNTFGKIGAVLAIVIFISGFKLAIESARIAPPEAMLWNLNFKQFLVFPMITIFLFAGFVTVGVLKRKNPAIHRPMMLMASITAVAAAADRIPVITSLYANSIVGSLLGPMAFPFFFGLILMIVQYALSRSIERTLVIAWAIVVVLGACAMQIAPTPAWDSIANILYRF
ncbi:MAG: hypothetical protein AB3N63_12475 [Puniceicoccaceae bacterium]